jgi:hypothetical protein
LFGFIVLFVILLSPVIRTIKARDVEIELRAPIPAAFDVSAAMLEGQITELETESSISD